MKYTDRMPIQNIIKISYLLFGIIFTKEEEVCVKNNLEISFFYHWSLRICVNMTAASIQPSECCLECVDSIFAAYLQALMSVVRFLPVLLEIKVSVSV